MGPREARPDGKLRELRRATARAVRHPSRPARSLSSGRSLRARWRGHLRMATGAGNIPTRSHYTGRLSCLRGGTSTVLPRSMASARAMRGRIPLGKAEMLCSL